MKCSLGKKYIAVLLYELNEFPEYGTRFRDKLRRALE